MRWSGACSPFFKFARLFFLEDARFGSLLARQPQVSEVELTFTLQSTGTLRPLVLQRCTRRFGAGAFAARHFGTVRLPPAVACWVVRGE